MTVTPDKTARAARAGQALIVHHHAVLRRGLERRAGALCEASENASGSSGR
jgi:hypothetical protein